MFIEQPPAIVRKLYPGTLWRINPKEKAVYLTFDDGPDDYSPSVTQKVADAFAANNGSATLFFIGNSFTKDTDEGVAKYGYTYFDWNVDSGDASGKLSASKIVNNVLQGAKGKNSICVLMHDAAAKTTTVDALPGIIKGLKEQGFTFKPLTKESYGYHHSVQN